MDKITEIIPDDLPDWAREAMADGQLFNRMLQRIEELENPEECATDVRWLQAMCDQLRKRIEELGEENELMRMQLAACSTVSYANTPESAAKVRDMHPDYKSVAVNDVCGAVDREMSLIGRIEAALRLADEWDKPLSDADDFLTQWGCSKLIREALTGGRDEKLPFDDETLAEIVSVITANGYQQEWNDLMDSIEELEAECDQLGADLNGTLDRAVVAESRIEAALKIARAHPQDKAIIEALTGGKDD